VGLIRQTEQYRRRFVAIRAPDGTLLMTEAEYIATERNYYDVLQRYGYEAAYGSAESYAAFFRNGITARDLDQRLGVYQAVQRGSSHLRNAFYIFAGVSMSDDDLYSYIVDPNVRATADQVYRTRATSQTLDYPTYVKRVAEVATNDALRTLTNLSDAGMDVSGQTSALMSSTPAVREAYADGMIQHGRAGGFITSEEHLVHSLELAMLGAAASEQGFALPSAARIEQFLSAGVDRTRALQEYGQFAARASALNAQSQRARGRGFGQYEFENATFLSSASDILTLTRAIAQERAVARGEGSFSLSQDRSGRLVQSGFASYRD
jgi:hypothetical protein